MDVPSNMKIHTIIEKTALFVNDQGGQMEIIIKMKQQANPQFAFMQLENPLYPYYKFLVEEIKSGSYKPIQEKSICQDDNEDYLHPSLLSGKNEIVPEFTVPSINFCPSEDDIYSVLVRNVQQQLAEEKAAKEEKEPIDDEEEPIDDEKEPIEEEEEEKEPIEENSIKEENNYKEAPGNQQLVDYSFNDSYCTSENSFSTVSFTVPPPYIHAIIQKMVEYVTKNGEDFENAVMCKNDKRLEFLNPSCAYHSYYIHLRDKAKLQLTVPDIATQIVPTNQSVRSRIESPNQPAEMNVIQTEIPEALSENHLEQETVMQSTVDECNSVFSEDVVIGTEHQFSEVLPGEQCNSLDSVDSSSVLKKMKSLNVPVSFSLKVKECDIEPADKLKIPLFLNSCDEGNYEEASKENHKTQKRKKSDKKHRSAPNSRHDNVKKKKKPKSTIEMEVKLVDKRLEILNPSCEYHNDYVHLQGEVKHQITIPDIVTESVPTVVTEQSFISEIESLNHPAEVTVIQTEISKADHLLGQKTVPQSTVDKDNFLCSQDIVFGTQHQFSEVFPEEQCNSLNSVNSSCGLKEMKSYKVPVSFSLKVTESDVLAEKLKIPLLCNNCGEGNYEETSKEKGETQKTEKCDKGHGSVLNCISDNVKEKEKPKSASEMKVKLDRMRNELLSAARQKLAQRKKEKQLQMVQKMREEQFKKKRQENRAAAKDERIELQLKMGRKRKTALFLKMLKKGDGGDTDTLPARLSNDNKNSKFGKSKQDCRNLSDTSKNISKKNGIFPVSKLPDLRRTVPQSKNGLSSSSATASKESGKKILITDPTAQNVPVHKKNPEPVKHKYQQRKRSRSRSREHHSNSSQRDRHRSRSPRRYRHEQSRKENELPSTYASGIRSLNRHHSPKPYRDEYYRSRRR